MKGEYLKTAIAACLVMSAMIAGTVSFGFFMDPVTSDLGFDRSTFSLYFSLITIVGTITLPIYGKLIMKYGTRRFVICGGIWTGLVMAAFSLCDSLVTFYIVGCLVGLGFFGCSYAVVPVIVNAWFVEKNGSVMVATAACGGIVAMVLSMVFPMLIESMGWRTGYIFLGVVVFLLTVPAGALLLHSAPRRRRTRTLRSRNERRRTSCRDARGERHVLRASTQKPEAVGNRRFLPSSRRHRNGHAAPGGVFRERRIQRYHGRHLHVGDIRGHHRHESGSQACSPTRWGS